MISINKRYMDMKTVSLHLALTREEEVKTSYRSNSIYSSDFFLAMINDSTADPKSIIYSIIFISYTGMIYQLEAFLCNTV